MGRLGFSVGVSASYSYFRLSLNKRERLSSRYRQPLRVFEHELPICHTVYRPIDSLLLSGRTKCDKMQDYQYWYIYVHIQSLQTCINL